MSKADPRSLTVIQRETLDRIARGSVSMVNTGYGSFRTSGALGPVVGRLVSLRLARWPKGPVGEQTCEITDAGRAALAGKVRDAKADLPALVDLVQGKLNALPPIDLGDLDSSSRYHRAADAALAELEHEAGAKVSRGGSAETLTLGGVRTSCTHGSAGLMRNWLNAAGRKLSAGGA